MLVGTTSVKCICLAETLSAPLSNWIYDFEVNAVEDYMVLSVSRESAGKLVRSPAVVKDRAQNVFTNPCHLFFSDRDECRAELHPTPKVSG